MPEQVVSHEFDAMLEKLTKVRLEITGSFNIPFIEEIFKYMANERATMDKDNLKRIDNVKAQMAEDAYAIYRKALVTLKLLEPIPARVP